MLMSLHGLQELALVFHLNPSLLAMFYHLRFGDMAEKSIRCYGLMGGSDMESGLPVARIFVAASFQYTSK